MKTRDLPNCAPCRFVLSSVPSRPSHHFAHRCLAPSVDTDDQLEFSEFLRKEVPMSGRRALIGNLVAAARRAQVKTPLPIRCSVLSRNPEEPRMYSLSRRSRLQGRSSLCSQLRAAATMHRARRPPQPAWGARWSLSCGSRAVISQARFPLRRRDPLDAILRTHCVSSRGQGDTEEIRTMPPIPDIPDRLRALSSRIC